MAKLWDYLKKEDREKLEQMMKAWGIKNWKPPKEDIDKIMRQRPKWKRPPK